MEDLRIRDRLAALADEVPPQVMVPTHLVASARRRALLVVGATVAVVALASFGLAGGVLALLRSERSLPAVPSPTPPPAGTQDLITVISMPYRGEVPIGAVVVDPDGEPSAGDHLGIAPQSIPLGWSPDGQRLLIAFPGGGLSVRGPDGIVVNLGVSPTGFWGGSWSPDGSQVVFGRAFGDRTSLHLIDADGSNERVLLDAGPSERFLYPSWSPDGSTIAFLRTMRFTPVLENSNCDAACERANDRGTQLWIVGADGSDPRAVITDVSARASSYNAPAWSPDGLQFLFSAYTGTGEGDVQVFVGDASGASIQITTGPGDALAPTWSPDGLRIAFVRQVDEEHVLRVAGYFGEDERSFLSLAVPAVYEASPVLWDRLPPL